MRAEPAGRSPQIWSHRGRLRPAEVDADNTVAAFARVASADLDGLELDTWMTLDERWVVVHDRDTPGGPVDRLARADLPGLPDLLDCLQAGDVGTRNVEVKVAADPDPERADLLARRLLDELGRLDGGVTTREVVSSFAPGLTDRLAELCAANPGGPRVSLLCMAPPGPAQLARLAAAGYWGVHTSGELLARSPGAVGAIHAAGLAVVAWTVNDPEAAAALATAGVDALITDSPLLLRATLGAVDADGSLPELG